MLERRRAARDRGAAAVEAALVLPLLLMLVFGIIDFGRMLNAQITVTEAAREGARAASLGSSTEAQARVDKVATNLGTVNTVPVGECPNDEVVEVDVTYDFRFVTPFAALANVAGGPFELTGKGVMPCRA